MADVQVVNGKIYAVIQNQNIDPTTEQQTYGPAGDLLGDLISTDFSGGTPTSVASFGPYEAANNPDHGAGAGGPGEPRHRQRSLRCGGLQRRARRRRCRRQRRAVRRLGGADLHAGRPPPDLRADVWWAGDGPAGPHLLGRRAGRPLYVGELGGVGGPGTGNDVGDVNVYRIAQVGRPRSTPAASP